MKLLVRLLRGRAGIAALAAGACLFAALVTLQWNAGLGGIVDAVSAGGSLDGRTLMGAAGVMLLMGLMQYAKAALSAMACERMAHDLRMGYARHFLSLPMERAEAMNAGEALSALQNEMEGITGALNGSLFPMLDNAEVFLATFAYLLAVHPALTLATLLPALPLVIYAAWSSRIIGSATSRAQQAKAEMNRGVDALLTLFPVLRLYGAMELVLGGYKGAVDTWQAQATQVERSKARLMSISAALSCLPILMLMTVGGGMVMRGGMTVGRLYVFLNLMGGMTGVLMNAPGHVAAFRQFAANMERVQDRVEEG